MPSRKLGDLDPRMKSLVEEFIVECEKESIDILITCTYRSNKEQAEAYAQGRTTPGKIITKAKPGESKHNVVNTMQQPASKAVDVVPLRLGKCVWDDKDPVWPKVGEIGERVGLDWAGRWNKSMKELAHFQLKE